MHFAEFAVATGSVDLRAPSEDSKGLWPPPAADQMPGAIGLAVRPAPPPRAASGPAGPEAASAEDNYLCHFMLFVIVFFAASAEDLGGRTQSEARSLARGEAAPPPP